MKTRIFRAILSFVMVVTLVLAGTVTAFAAVTDLPSGYTKVDYIESEGSSHIDTGWASSSAMDSYAYEIEYAAGAQMQTANKILCGSNGVSERVGCINFRAEGHTSVAFGTVTGSRSPIKWATTTDRTTVKLEVNLEANTWNITKDGAAIAENPTGTINGTPINDNTLYVFRNNNGSGGDYDSIAKVYGLKIWEDDTLVRDFVPCIEVATGTAGLYDLVNEKFHGAAGSGLIYGPEGAPKTTVKFTTPSDVDLTVSKGFAVGYAEQESDGKTMTVMEKTSAVTEGGITTHTYTLPIGNYRFLSMSKDGPNNDKYYNWDKNFIVTYADVQNGGKTIDADPGLLASAPGEIEWEQKRYNPSYFVRQFTDELLAIPESNVSDELKAKYPDVYTTPTYTNLDKGRHQYTTQAELEAFLETLDAANSEMSCYVIGKTDEGRNLMAAIFTLSDISGKTLAEAAEIVKANGKPTIQISAQVHGDEQSGAEGALATAAMLCGEYGESVLDKVNVIIMPRMNPDGSKIYKYESGVNHRGITRDHMSVTRVETRAMINMYNLFEPEVVLDQHEFRPATQNTTGAMPDIKISETHNLNLPQELVALEAEFVANQVAKGTEEGFRVDFYRDGVIETSPAATKEYYSLRGSIGFIHEIPGQRKGRQQWERRTMAHFLSIKNTIDFTAENADRVNETVAKAKADIAAMGKTYDKNSLITLLHVKGSTFEVNRPIFNFADGSYVSKDSKTTLSKFDKASVTRPRPTAYIIPKNTAKIADILDVVNVHNIKYSEIPAGMSLDVRGYTGNHWGAELTATKSVSFDKGAYIFPVAQESGIILTLLMEPDMLDGARAVTVEANRTGYPSDMHRNSFAQQNLLPVSDLYRYEGAVENGGLPLGYNEVEYISSEGGAYFDSGLYATDGTKIEAKFSYSKEGAYLYGVSSSGNTKTLSSSLKGSAASNWRLIDSVAAVQLSMNTVHTTVHDASGVTVDGVLVANSKAPAADAATPNTFLIGNLRGLGGGASGSSSQFEGDIYSIKISEDGVLVRNFVPCYRVSDNVAGLYDTVNGVFYESTGSAEFTYPGQEKKLIDAPTGIVVNADTGEVYFSKEPTLEHAMASTTKIMTAILAIENLDLESRTLPAIASDQVSSGNTRINLAIGEQLTVKDALYGLMLPSGNDAANLLGRTVAGSYEAFSEMMNAKAKELGCENTCFTTVAGTDAPGHYTTVADYAVIASYAMSLPAFRQIVATTHYTIEADAAHGVLERALTNTNYLLPGLDLDGTVYSYEGITGIKTGTTTDAGACLVASATRSGTDLISVVFGAPGNTSAINRFTESTKLLDYGFAAAAAQPYTVTAEGNTLTVVNPKTGYTMTATISASDSAYTGEAIETAAVTTTYPKGVNWYTDWEVAYTNNTEIGTATASITFGGKTASCTFKIVEPTVTLTQNTEVDTLVVPAGQTYDLDGYSLSVHTGLVVNNGGKIIDGVLTVDSTTIVSLGDNGGWVPVLDADHGTHSDYILYPADIKAGKTVVSTLSGTAYSFGYKLTENGVWTDPYGDAITASAADSIKFGVSLSLDAASADYTFSHASVKKMAGISASASSDEFFKVNLNLVGGNNPLTKVRVAPVIKVSDLGFRYVGEATGEGSGEIVARINTEGYYTLEDAVAAAAAADKYTEIKLVGDMTFKRPVTIRMNGKTRFITLARSNIQISGPVTFDGQSDKDVNADCLLFRVYGNSTLTLKKGVKIVNVKNVNADNPTSSNSFGAVFRVESATLNMDGVTVENCEGACRGAIYATTSANIDIKNSTFRNNAAATQFGGAVAIYTGGSVNVENSVFEGNSAKTYGGAIGIYSGDAAVVLKNNTFKNNSAVTYGGAVGVSPSFTGTLSVDGGTYSGNSSDVFGVSNGSFSLKGAPVGLNRITLSGGATVMLNDTLTLAEDSKIAINGTIGAAVLDGSKVADYYTFFTGASTGEYITADGILRREGEATYVAEVNGTQYTSLVNAVAAANAISSGTVYVDVIGSESFSSPTVISLNGNVMLRFTKSATLSGPLTIDGGNVSHSVNPITVKESTSAATGITATLKGVTVQNFTRPVSTTSSANYGAALRTNAYNTIVLDGCSVTGNKGEIGAIYVTSNGTLITKNGTVISNNESLRTQGVINLNAATSVIIASDTTFSGNKTAKGRASAVAVISTASSFTNCTFTGNTGAAPAVLNVRGATALTIKNCSFTNNSSTAADSAVICTTDTATTATLTLEGCTFTDNTTSYDVNAVYGSLTIDGATTLSKLNLAVGKAAALGDAVSFSGNVTLTGVSDGQTVLTGDKTADCAEYFIGANAGEYVDASGVFHSTAPVVNYIATVGSAKYETLSAAIKATENVTDATTITLYGDETVTEATTVTLNPNVQIKVTANSVISGPLTIDGANEAHTAALPILVDGCKLTLKNGVKLQNIKNEYRQNYCGMIRVQNTGALELDGIEISDCTGPFGIIGGQSNSTFVVKDSIFRNNAGATDSGGVFFIYGASLTVENSTFTGNSSAARGGAIHCGSNTSVLTLTGCTFTDNTAATDGGAISGYSCKTLTLNGCTFSNNTAKGVSEDIYYNNGTLNLKCTTSLETVRITSGKTIALNDTATFAKTVTLTGTGAAAGVTVLSGSKVADYAEYFTVSDTLTVGTDGVVTAK